MILKTKILLFSGMVSLGMAFSAYAQNQTVKTENVTEKGQPLTAPIVEEHKGDFKAMMSSADKNISLHVYQSKNDPISGYRYARGFANGFASPEKTGDKPIYTTDTYEDGLDIPQSYVRIYIDGEAWTYDGSSKLSPQLAGMLLAQILDDYVVEHGTDKLVN